MKAQRNDSQAPQEPNGTDPDLARPFVDALEALERAEIAAAEFFTASFLRVLTAAQELSIRQLETFVAITESLVASLGGVARKMMAAIGETSEHAVDTGRKAFERVIEAAGSVGEASARRAERVAVRSLGANSEVNGALRAALRGDLRAPTEGAASGAVEVA